MGVRECGSTSIPCSISTSVTWNRLREYGTAGVLVSDCAQESWTAGALFGIPRSISTLVTWNRLQEYGTAGALVSDCAQECWTTGALSGIPRSISTLVTWNRLREYGTAVALVVYPLNIFFLATVGLLDCRRSTRFTHLDLSARDNTTAGLREEFYN